MKDVPGDDGLGFYLRRPLLGYVHQLGEVVSLAIKLPISLEGDGEAGAVSTHEPRGVPQNHEVDGAGKIVSDELELLRPHEHLFEHYATRELRRTGASEVARYGVTGRHLMTSD